MLRVLGSASRTSIKSEYRLTRKGRDARTSRQPRSEVRTAPVWPQFPPSSPISALCSDQKRKLQLKGRKCEERKDLDPSWCASPGAAFTGHLVLLVPQGTNSHLTYIPGCTVTPCGWGWRHSGGPPHSPPCHQCVQEQRNTYLMAWCSWPSLGARRGGGGPLADTMISQLRFGV